MCYLCLKHKSISLWSFSFLVTLDKTAVVSIFSWAHYVPLKYNPDIILCITMLFWLTPGTILYINITGLKTYFLSQSYPTSDSSRVVVSYLEEYDIVCAELFKLTINRGAPSYKCASLLSWNEQYNININIHTDIEDICLIIVSCL